MKWEIEDHASWAKHFVINGPLPLIIDNDDVPSDLVLILAKRVARVLNDHWVAPFVYMCEHEDCDDSFNYFGVMDLPGGKCPECDNPMNLFEVEL